MAVAGPRSKGCAPPRLPVVLRRDVCRARRTLPMMWRTAPILPHDVVTLLAQRRRASVRGNSLHEQQMAAGTAAPAVALCPVRRVRPAGGRRRPALAGLRVA